jgi:hypothetical protein
LKEPQKSNVAGLKNVYINYINNIVEHEGLYYVQKTNQCI